MQISISNLSCDVQFVSKESTEIFFEMESSTENLMSTFHEAF